ncbi:outer membrane protein assembly factor BamB [Neptuniibacter caesariensis]|uniref:Outer membrane protein assembly factor BamB n=1 Tax=Neptuniibacter caesariensis TaxID=207954 RepID=A0A7U8GQU0_NEPCE|nr:outer membrane protein assembly factor BamB [Neptuniibacter caesariensis]EAR59666.1 PQQ enzyme repeat domain protein [Oceanospirillum sp. MED92] [Neptuniibacter caesariensis]
MKSIYRFAGIALVSLAVTGCGFWGDDGEEIKPSPLVSFDAEKKVDVLWSVSVGSGAGNKFNQFQPAIDGEMIFAADKDGTVVAVNRTSGKKLWQVELEIAIVGGVGAGFGKVAVAGEEGEVIVLSAEDGSELWRDNVRTEVTAAAQFNRDIAVFQLINGKVIAFDASTGSRAWTYDSQVPRLTLRGTSSPIVASDVTFAGFASGKLVALDNAKGTAIWENRVALPQGRSELERMVDIDGRPLLVDGMLYVTSYQGRLVAINPFRAQVVWAQDVSSYRSLAAGFGNIYVSEEDDAVQAFDRSSSASVWRQAKLENREISAPAVLDSTVAVADYEGYIHFMSQTDGRFVARYQVDSSGVYGDMISKDDVLYVLGNSGRLAALQLQ